MAERFLAFIADAVPALGRAASTSVTASPRHGVQEVVDDFQAFISAALEVVVQRVVELLPALRQRVLLVQRWLVRDDLLAIARLTFVEDAYTELLAWALNPLTHPASAAARQRAWLDSIGLTRALFSAPATPRTQVWTDDGIPDLLLAHETFAVVVEAKTGTSEHLTPSSTMQTVAYPVAVRPLVNNDTIYMVFITPDRALAANELPLVTSFGDLALTLAETLGGLAIDGETRYGFAMLITHLMTRGIGSRLPVRESISGLAAWLSEAERPRNVEVMNRMPELLALMTVFGTE